MTNSVSNMNLIKQPQPSVKNTVNDTQRQYNLPKVGVVSVPTITKTPLADTIEVKRQEKPRMAYKLTPKKSPGFKFQTISTLGIISCGIMALISLCKKKPPIS